MRETYTINDGYGTQVFSTWEAARKWLFVLRGRFANDAPECGYQNGLFFDTDSGDYRRNDTATAHRVKQIVMAGYQCTLIDGADRHPTHITITPTQMWTAKDMDAEWRRISPQTTEESA